MTMTDLKYWCKKFLVGVAFGGTAGCAVYGAYALFEWAVGFPAQPYHIAFGVGATAAIAGWNS